MAESHTRDSGETENKGENQRHFKEYDYNVGLTKSSVNDHHYFHQSLQFNKFTNIQEIVNLKPFSLTIKGDKKEGKSYYELRVVTEKQENVTFEMNANIHIELVGESARTGKITLPKIFSPQYPIIDDYIVMCDENLGDISVVTIGMSGHKSTQWYVDYTYVAEVTKTGKCFPCYHWISSSDYFSLAACCGTLAQVKDIPHIAELRRTQLENRKKSYQWKIFSDLGIPSGIDVGKGYLLPLDERFDSVKQTEFLGNLVKSALTSFGGASDDIIQQSLYSNLGVSTTANESPRSLHDYHNLALILQGKSAYNKNIEERGLIVCEAARWTSDVEFGRQILNGVNPVVIQRCTKLPGNFPVTDGMVKSSLNKGYTLEEEIQGGSVYICDLSDLMDELPCKKGRYCAAPLCLLYVNSADRLVPIAIQLHKNPSEKNPIFLPSDNWIDWLMAKMYFFSALGQQHQLSTHYNSCHAAMEAYGVATMRNIPDSHPVYKLLRPAFHYTMAINVRARHELINEGGIIDRLFSIGFDEQENYPPDSGKNELFIRTNKKYSVHWTNIKKDIERRGVESIPYYYYRDDGIKMWDAIEHYVKSILELFYTCDADVEQDLELKEWSEEIHNSAFPGFHENPSGRGFPLQITKIAELVEYCTLITFTGSVQHAAVNFGQFQMYGFAPNAPSNLRKPLPSVKGKATIEDVMDALPNYLSAALMVSVVFSLSQFGLEEIYLGGLPTMWYTGQKEQQCVKSFLDSLEKINKEIEDRNKEIDIGYKYILSHNVPMSITI